MLKFSGQVPKPSMVRVSIPTSLIVGVVLSLMGAAPALADPTNSSNWAGYAIHGNGVRFTRAVGAWTQPRPSCAPGSHTFSAMWVGLGGFNETSQALEQIGTEVDCTPSGKAVSNAWFELVPSPSRRISLRVRPGDSMQATVSVTGHRVVLALRNLTTHRSFQKTLSATTIDVSSAEWIVEAPSQCTFQGSCQTLPLADFGSVTFGKAQAQTTSGHTGSISDPNWNRTRIRLVPGGHRFVIYRGNGLAAGAATTSTLQRHGSSFKVTYRAIAIQAQALLAGRRATLQSGYIVHSGRW